MSYHRCFWRIAECNKNWTADSKKISSTPRWQLLVTKMNFDWISWNYFWLLYTFIWQTFLEYRKLFFHNTVDCYLDIRDTIIYEIFAVNLSLFDILLFRWNNIVVPETLRKYPILPILHRECTADCVIEEANLKIEKGQKLMISILGLHYDPKYFPEPDKFDPERFSEENKRNILPYSYIPFGEGPRQCIGEEHMQCIS